MKYLIALVTLAALVPAASADVYIPDREYAGYFDGDGTYTVVGAIKNTGNEWAEPTLRVTIEDAGTHAAEFVLAPIRPGSEQPFKVKFPELVLQNPVLPKPEIQYRNVAGTPLKADVIYDDTLILHPDGHKTGRIVNAGDEPARYLKVYALIYAEDGRLLDMGQSLEVFETVGPGEMRDFTIIPDPSVASEARYYSCFAVGDVSVIQINTERKGEAYSFRYDSGAWFAYSRFSDDGGTLVMRTQNSFPLPVMTNLEFPRSSDSERFSVLLNDEPVEHKQSLDDMGNWHVVFEMPAHTSGLLSVSGFEDPGEVSAPGDVLRTQAAGGSDTGHLYYLVVIPIVAIAAGLVLWRKR